MEPVLLPAAIMLAIVAMLGAANAFVRFSRHANPPRWLVHTHGGFAILTLVVLTVTVAMKPVPSAAIFALALLLLAAAGGLFMYFGPQRTGKPIPKPVVVGHAAVALAGYALLLASSWLPGA